MALVGGQPREREMSGLGDPRFRFSINLFGAPALSAKEFANYQQDLIIGASLQVSAPLGQYDDSKLLNLGNNRWSFKPELGISKAWGPWTVEVAPSVTFFTDNTDFFNGSTFAQAPIYAVQGRLGLVGPVLAQAAPVATAAAAPPPSAAVAAKAVESTREVVLRISREVWTNAERTLAEEKSAAIYVRELTAAGFKVTTGTSNIPTAFLAEWSQGSGGPKIGFLPEYDALPSLGNAAEPRKTPGPTGFEVGHGCGHNLPGAGCTGAAIALKKMMEQDKTTGTVLVFGCAAEEGGAVKTYMARDGLFNDVDAALSWHPGRSCNKPAPAARSTSSSARSRWISSKRNSTAPSGTWR